MRCSLPIVPVCFALAVSAQPGGDAGWVFSVDHAGVPEGLLHREAHRVLQDAGGFLWIASPAGVQRFDGHRFKDFTINEGLSGVAVADILQDADGLLWVTYRAGGASGRLSAIDLLDPRTGRVEPFADHFGTRAPCSARSFSERLTVTADGSLVLATDSAFHIYRSAAEGFHTIRVKGGPPGLLKPLVMTAHGDCWAFRTTDRSDRPHLFRVDPQGQVDTTTVRHLRTGIVGSYRRPGTMGPEGVHFLYAEGEGAVHELWILPDGTLVDRSEDLSPALLGTWTGSVLIPLGDGLWLADAQVRRMREGDAVLSTPVVLDLAEKHPAIAVHPFAAWCGRSGMAWIGTAFGLYKLGWRPSPFGRMLHDADIPRGYGHSVRGMAWVDDRLLVNTEVMGRYVLDPRNGTVLHADPTDSLRYGMVPDGHGGVWDAETHTLLHRREGRTDTLPQRAPRII